jgi:hypothetical protein
MLQGMPLLVVPQACVQFHPWHGEMTLTGWLPKYHASSAVLMLHVPILSAWNDDWPDRQCARQVGLNTPVPAGSASISASTCCWKAAMNAY